MQGVNINEVNASLKCNSMAVWGYFAFVVIFFRP